ncbi:MAG: carbohydrate ABC transporter permease [Aestuariivirga sp.]
MPGSGLSLRYAAALAVVALFMFPIFWLGLTSLKPLSAIYNKDEVVFFSFTPQFQNYNRTFIGTDSASSESRQTILDTVVVAGSSTLLAVSAGLLAAYALSMFTFRRRRFYIAWIIFQRILPPIAVIIPLILIYNSAGLIDTRSGLILAYAAMNLPLAVLMLKSFFDDVPREVGEAAMIDGATRFQVFARIAVPMIRGGIAATAVLCFVFSWTEFIMAVFLTHSIRMMSVQLSLYTDTASDAAVAAALSFMAITPAFMFILLVQKHLVRGLTLGATK